MSLFSENVCLGEVSKDAQGKMRVAKQKRQQCKKPKCRTLKARYQLILKVRRNRRCDRVPGLTGSIKVKLEVATRKDGLGRGIHDGLFQWKTKAGTIAGTMRGTINAGTHRKPLKGCEPCNAQGHMEGLMAGKFQDGKLKGCRLVASYVIQYNAGREAQDSELRGTLEGAVLCPCKRG